MALNQTDKKQIIDEVSAEAAEAMSMIAAEYRGLTVEQMTNLRKACREAGVTIRVVKNTLARLAVKGTSHEEIAQALVGPIVIAFSKETLNAPARVFKAFAKDNKQLVVAGLSIGDGFVPGSELDRIASLPTRDEAIATLMATMKEPAAKLARTLAALRDAKEAA
jgi:large subunit ribosomal protein L10